MLRRTFAAALLAGLLAAGCADTDISNPIGEPAPQRTAQVVTVAGTAEANEVDGNLQTARFNNPVNVEIGPGALYVVDYDGNSVRKITPEGDVSTIFTQAEFSRPFGITLGKDGFLYVETDANDTGQRDGTTGTIWRIDPVAKTGSVVVRNIGRPRGLATLPDGRIVMSNLTRNVVELLSMPTPNTTVIVTLAGEDGVAGNSNGQGTAAHFDRAYGPAVLPDGSILLADQNNNVIRQVGLDGQVTTFAGTGAAGLANGAKDQAQFDHPQDVSVLNGRVYVTDNGNHVVRVIDEQGNVSTLAGDGTAGFRDGDALQAQFFGMEGLCATAQGILVADGTGGDDVPFNRVRAILNF